MVGRLGLLVGAFGASIFGCAAAMYPGPKRPDSETMLVETSGMTVVRIDNTKPPSADQFRLLPGMHRIDVAVRDGISGPGIRYSKVAMPACFAGLPGHTYLLRPQYLVGSQWRPQVIDENATSAIASDGCSHSANDGDGDPSSSYERTLIPAKVPAPAH